MFSIKCYVCNSGYKYAGENCSDIQKLKAGNYLKDCADEEVKDRVPNGTYKYCRVFSQTGGLCQHSICTLGLLNLCIVDY